MAVKTTKYKDLLDYTVSYRTVWTAIAVVFALLVAGGIAWIKLKPPSEDEKARQEVKSAERLKQRADGCAQMGLKPDQEALIGDAREKLEAAESALARKEFGPAREAARLAQESLKVFVDKVCAAHDAVAEIVRIQGDVKVKKVQSPRWVEARKGSLSVGDRIRTDNGFAQIAYKLSSEIQDLGPGTMIEIKDVLQGPDGANGVRIGMESGNTTVHGTPNSPTEVLAPQNTIITPKGSVTEIESPQGGEVTRVTTLRGETQVTKDGKTVVVPRGMRAEARAAGLGALEKTLDPPELKEPIEGRVFSSEKPEDKVIAFTWLPVDGAQKYLWDVARNDVFAPVLNAGDAELWGQSPASLDAPPPNTYYWRVAGIDAKGVRGTWSEVRRFSVRGINVSGGNQPPPPVIELSKPIEFGNRAIVKGKTAQYVTLEVLLNGRKYGDVTVDEKGEFQTLVTLSQEGANTIEFVAHDTYGQETRKKVTAHFTL